MKTALITGVSGGIGRATAEIFLNAGWQVFGMDKFKEKALPKGLKFAKVDIGDTAELEKYLNKISSEVKRLDTLVNNAAYQICKPIEETGLADWEAVMAVNLRPIYLTAKYLRPAMKAGSAIVNVSSVHASATSANISAYAASKGGVIALTRAMAVEFAKAGIRVNSVLPGAVDTQMLRQGLERGQFTEDGIEEKIKAVGARTPLGRVGRPEEIAEAIFFLADNSRSSFITGEGLVVDGGALARLSTE